MRKRKNQALFSLPKLVCERCGWTWTPRRPEPPAACPRCKRFDWDKPRDPKAPSKEE